MLPVGEHLLPSPNTVDLSLPSAVCVSVRVRVFGRMDGERQSVCLHACSVCAYDTAVDWRALVSIWSWMSSRDVYTKYLLLSLFSCLIHIPCCTLSSLDHSGKDLGMRAVVLSSFVWTVIHIRWLISFAGTSCIVRQHRSFFQHVKRRFGACFNSQRQFCSNQAGSNPAEQTIDNCNGTKRVQS